MSVVHFFNLICYLSGFIDETSMTCKKSISTLEKEAQGLDDEQWIFEVINANSTFLPPGQNSRTTLK